MPHFIIDCSKSLLQVQSPENLMQAVHATAESTGLFQPGDIKVRIRPYEHYLIAGEKHDFIHVFAFIREGRSDAQHKVLSERVVLQLRSMFEGAAIISMNIQELDKLNYYRDPME